MKTELIDFWPYANVGHADFNGVDVGQHFLRNLFEEIDSNRFSRSEIYSHFSQIPRLSVRSKQAIDRLSASLSKDKIKKSLRLYGHDLNKHQLGGTNLNVWYTPENVRPPLQESFDIFLSHDLDRYDGRNLYLPIWATRLGVDIENSILEQKKLLLGRDIIMNQREGVCAVISNPEPIRMAFLKELQKHTPVDIYGAFAKPLNDKKTVMSQYRINICFENNEFPGYVTEKSIEAWKYGCVPVWRGLDSGGYLNDKALVNVTGLGFQESIKQIIAILDNDDHFKEISSCPILTKPYEFLDLRNRILELIQIVER
jgi:hypothetical protein